MQHIRCSNHRSCRMPLSTRRTSCAWRLLKKLLKNAPHKHHSKRTNCIDRTLEPRLPMGTVLARHWVLQTTLRAAKHRLPHARAMRLGFQVPKKKTIRSCCLFLPDLEQAIRLASKSLLCKIRIVKATSTTQIQFKPLLRTFVFLKTKTRE